MQKSPPNAQAMRLTNIFEQSGKNNVLPQSPYLSVKNMTLMTPFGQLLCEKVCFNVCVHERWMLLGENGVGKTTLLYTLAGITPFNTHNKLEKPSNELSFFGKPSSRWHARNLAQRVAFLPQHPTYPPEQTVQDKLLTARYPFHPFWQTGYSPEDRDIIHAVANQFELSDYLNRPLSSLSGGEKQRVSIAGIFAQTPDLLLMDEPNTFLDLRHQHKFFKEVVDFCKHKEAACIISIQDLNFAVQYGTHALLLFGNGEWIAGPLPDILTDETVSRLYRYPMTRCPLHLHWMPVENSIV